MKNQMFNFQIAAVAAAIRASKMQWMFIAAMLFVQLDVMACNLSAKANLPIAHYAGWTFHGEAVLSPAANAGASLFVQPLFEDYIGFGAAVMDATLSGDRGRLHVTISNVSISELPAHVNLGIVTLFDGDVEREFVVKTDGIGSVVVEDSF